jgi:tRNA uridine 5-carbamoylmethylation protein Kti12
MPLVLFCGPPCSGKTTRAKALYEHIKNELKRDAVLINEESLLIKKNEGYIGTYLCIEILSLLMRYVPI